VIVSYKDSHLPLHLQEKGVFLHIVKKLTDNGRKD
jgi:hypothetical protein